MKKYLLALVCFLFTTVYAEKLFEVSWNAEDTKIVYQEASLNLGPQAIAVNEKHVYILANFQNRVLVFDKSGNYLHEIQYQNAPGCGLAVSDEGTIAIYSPIEKRITWINGDLKGKTAQAPESFSSISEVWFQNQDWWVRCGWKVQSISENSRANYSNVFAIDESTIAVQIHTPQVHSATLNIAESVAGVWSLGAWKNYQEKACIILATTEKKQIFTCDLQGNCSEAIEPQRSWSSIFSPYAAHEGYLYEMVTSRQGIAIYRHSLVTRSSQKLNAKPGIPEDLQKFLSTPQKSQQQANTDRALPSNINVFFRHEGRVREVSLQSYLKNVVSAEIYGSWTLEVHKAMAVASRTYAVARTRHPETSPQALVCTSTHCQAWKADITWKAEQAVDATNGVAIYHNGSIIREALYFAHCNGYTRNSEEKWNYVPYLRSKRCVCGKTAYYGHGVGACQWGLQGYSQQGWSYRQILEHYYTGTTVK